MGKCNRRHVVNVIDVEHRAEREKLLEEYPEGLPPPGAYADRDEVLDILAEAVAARKGWKRILKRCSNIRTRRGHLAPQP